MRRIVLVFLLVLILLSCTTHPPTNKEDTFVDTSPPHTVDDVSRTYSATFAEVLEACKLAINDVGANYLEPIVEIKENSATITAATRTRLYGVILLGYDDHTDVMLFLDDKSTDEVIKKSVFDEFWAAVEAHLQ